MVGMSSIVPFLPLFIRELGVTNLEETATWSGLVFAGPFFLSFFLAPIWGSLGDKYGRKVMILRAIFGLAIAQLIIGFSTDVTFLFIARLLQGALSGFLPAAMALVASNTPEDKTSYALGTLQSSTTAGNILGPLIGGVLSDIIGFRNVFFAVAGLLSITGFLVLIFVKEERRSEDIHPFSFIQNWKYLLHEKNLLVPSLLIMLTALGFSFVRPIFVLYIENLNISTNILPTITGALYSIVGLFSTIASPWWGRKAETIGIKKSLLYASIITGLMYCSHAFITDPLHLIPVRMILGFGFGALLPLMFSAVSKNVKVERRGGVIGVASSFQILGNMTGPIIGGYAVSMIGIKSAFILTGMFFFMMAPLIKIKMKNQD